MSGAKATPPSTETTKVEPKYALRLNTQAREDNGYTYDPTIWVKAELLKDGEVLKTAEYNWDSQGYYRDEAKEWADRQITADTILTTGPVVEEIEL